MKFEITKEQILELNNNSEKLKEWFPEAFKTKLGVGKWYKRPKNKCLFYIVGNTEIEPFEVYGFNDIGDWMNATKARAFPDEEIEATEEEVFEALKNEAVKRGFVKGSSFIPTNSKDKAIQINGDSFAFLPFENKLLVNNWCAFQNGVWAEIVETITKSEAEKLLNKKIID